MKNKFVEVALPLPIEKTFSYSVPEKLIGKVKEGVRVRVPFRNKKMTGFVLKAGSKARVKKTRPIISVVDATPVVNEKILKLAARVADDYLIGIGEALKFFAPVDLKEPKNKVLYETSTEPLQLKERANSEKNVLSEIDTTRFSLNGVYGLSLKERCRLYAPLISEILARGKSCLFLVPDVSFILPLEKFFQKEISPQKVFSFHSKLGDKEKKIIWSRARKTSALFIGAQQAVFLPFEKFGLVVVEEEHESLYKQRMSPYLDIKDIAVKRARAENCPAALAGAILSLETFYKIKKDRDARLIELEAPREKGNTKLIDLSAQKSWPFFISKLTEFRIAKALEEGGGVFLFLNRRGFSTYLHCPKCNFLKACPKCQVPLVYYYSKKKLICNHCYYEEELSKLCPACRDTYLKLSGAGIEKVESEIARMFAGAKAEVLSAEAAPDNHFFKVIRDYEKGKLDILIATQVLAKRPHAARARLVVLALADVIFNIPDFRAGERLFALIAQMKNLVKPEGEFIVQTFVPKSSVISYAVAGDMEGFYKEELKLRRKLGLPPFSYFVMIRMSSVSKDAVEKTAAALEVFLKEKTGGKIEISSAEPCFYSSVKGRHRWQLSLTSKNKKALFALIRDMKMNFTPHANARLTFDINPQELI